MPPFTRPRTKAETELSHPNTVDLTQQWDAKNGTASRRKKNVISPAAFTAEKYQTSSFAAFTLVYLTELESLLSLASQAYESCIDLSAGLLGSLASSAAKIFSENVKATANAASVNNTFLILSPTFLFRYKFFAYIPARISLSGDNNQ